MIIRTPAELLGPLNEVEGKHAPDRLYLAGDVSLLQHVPRVSIVGARKASSQALARAGEYARRLVANNVVVVSGLAEGIDTAAHTAAINAGGHTVAVLGTPLDRAYPAKNRGLQARIAQDYLVVSQFAVGTPTHPHHFPLRNRTMALMSHATIIVEARETSGSLHQGWEALRLGRLLLLDEHLVDDPSLEWPSKMIGYGAQRFGFEHIEPVIDELPQTSAVVDFVR
jgi:DNA processing protein